MQTGLDTRAAGERSPIAPNRWIIRTGYHYWTLHDTQAKDPSRCLQSFRARDYGGDRGARAAARAEADRLNAREGVNAS